MFVLHKRTKENSSTGLGLTPALERALRHTNRIQIYEKLEFTRFANEDGAIKVMKVVTNSFVITFNGFRCLKEI